MISMHQENPAKHADFTVEPTSSQRPARRKGFSALSDLASDIVEINLTDTVEKDGKEEFFERIRQRQRNDHVAQNPRNGSWSWLLKLWNTDVNIRFPNLKFSKSKGLMILGIVALIWVFLAEIPHKEENSSKRSYPSQPMTQKTQSVQTSPSPKVPPLNQTLEGPRTMDFDLQLPSASKFSQLPLPSVRSVPQKIIRDVDIIRVVVTKKKVNLRLEPSLKSEVYDQADKDDVFLVEYPPVRDTSDNSTWYKILFVVDEDEVIDWISAYVDDFLYISTTVIEEEVLTKKDKIQLDAYDSELKDLFGFGSEGIRGTSVTLTPKTPPAPGIYSNKTGQKSVAPFEIQTSGTGYYFVKLVAIRDDKPQKDRNITIFAHAGHPLEVKIPLGTYEMRYASGNTWYGEKNCFGKETAYAKSDEKFYFTRNGNRVRGYTVKLYKVQNGNMRTYPIDADAF
jgi:hypothetical protein